jgi:drug/metabolite transporter (DMT)-like permease
MKLKYLIILIVFNFLWAASLSVIQAMEAYMNYGGIVTMRFGVGAVSGVLVWRWLPGKCPRGWDLLKSILMGFIVFCLGHRLQVLGNLLGSAGNSSILMAVEPLLTAVAAAIFLHEKIGLWRWIGFALGMFGVILLNGVWRADFKMAGLFASVIFIASFLCEAAYSIIAKPLIERAGFMKILVISLVGGTLLNLAIDGAATVGSVRVMPVRAWLMAAYLGIVCTLAGYGIWLMVIRETDVNLTAMTILAQPVAGIPIAVLWLNEPLHMGQFWGSAAIVIGLLIGMRGSGSVEGAK